MRSASKSSVKIVFLSKAIPSLPRDVVGRKIYVAISFSRLSINQAGVARDRRLIELKDRRESIYSRGSSMRRHDFE